MQIHPVQNPSLPNAANRPWVWWLLVGLIFAAGLALRLYDLNDPPLDFHPTRQLHSALIARGMYYENLPQAPEWQRELAVRQWRAEGLIEPQVFERLTAWTYSLVGGPQLWVPRLYAILFWMLGAVFLTWLAADFAGWEGAAVAALFFLIWPYGVVASRAFQPDPLMVTLIAAAVWAAVRWERCPAWRWALAAGILAGLAIYIKAVAVFFIAPAFAALVITGRGLRPALRDRQVWVMAVLAVLPYTVYHLDGVYLRGFLVDQFSLRFFPEMWVDLAFYIRWVRVLSRAVPFGLCLAALVSALLLPRPAHRALLLAMWAGYFLYGMTLPHHISTHDYYHLPVYLLAACGLAAAAGLIFRSLRGPVWITHGLAVAVILVALVMTGYDARSTLKRSDYRSLAETWQSIGEQVGPGASVAIVSDDYGTGLAYWGWIAPVNWPTAEDIRWRESVGQPFDFQTGIAELVEPVDFFVVTDPAELEQQPELNAYLQAGFPVFAQADNYLIYDLR